MTDKPKWQQPHDDKLMTRVELAEALTEAGYPIRAGTLSTKVTRGGGPPHKVFGGRAIYRWGDALEWARAKAVSFERPARRIDRPASQVVPADPYDISDLIAKRNDAEEWLRRLRQNTGSE